MNRDCQQTKLAKQWDRAAEALEQDLMRPVRYRKCLRYVSTLNRNSKVVEIGCGEGTGLSSLKQLGFQQLMGFEVSAERLRRARSKLGEDVSLILGSPVGALPMRSGAVDAVISAAIIEHTVDPRAFVQEIARIVRPGGYVVISSDCYMWRILELLRLFRSIQPIDRALFPTTLFRYFKESGLYLVHYEGFPWPGHEFRFLRLFVEGLVKAFKRLVWKFMPSLAHWGVKRRLHQRPAPASSTHTVTSGKPFFVENWSKRCGVISFLKLLFSDENVFFLIRLR